MGGRSALRGRVAERGTIREGQTCELAPFPSSACARREGGAEKGGQGERDVQLGDILEDHVCLGEQDGQADQSDERRELEARREGAGRDEADSLT